MMIHIGDWFTMRTNILLDDKLMREAFKHSKSKTKKDLIHEALALFIQFKTRKDLKDLKGKISFADDYDHKKLRAG
jgi:Arc/MetJ family transcription regulator